MTRPLLALLVALCVLAACGGGGGPDGYSAEVHDQVMRGCVEDDTDPDLVEVCECTYDSMREEMDFATFERMERRLAQGEESLPGALTSIIRDCIRSISATRG